MRHLYFLGGLFFTGLGMIGAFLPLLPTVPFLLLALFCFARSNPAWEAKILNHPTWGPQVKDWRERGAISRKSKTIAISMIALSAAILIHRLHGMSLYIGLGILVCSATWIATRNE